MSKQQRDKPYHFYFTFTSKDSAKCAKCDGEGWYADHADAEHHTDEGECCGFCPIQVQCEVCQATGQMQIQQRSINIFWGRQSPFPDVQKEMTKQLGEGCTYAPQVGLENAEQRFD